MKEKKPLRRIIGIDPGYERCGYAFLQETAQGVEILEMGVIKTSAQKEFAERIFEISQDLESLMEKYKPDSLSMEDLFFVQNTTTGMKVSAVRGALLCLGVKFGCRIFEPKPVEVKQSFTGNGKASKAEMLQMAQREFNLEGEKIIDDAIDALAIAHWGLRRPDF